MNLLLVGFFGEGNLGDESILAGLTCCLPRNINLYVTNGPLKTQCLAKPIKRRGFLSWPHFLKTLQFSDKVVFSGGILQDWSLEGVTFFTLRLFASRLLKKKPSLWGAGIGPFRHKFTRSIAGRALLAAEEVWLRDLTSSQLFTSLTKRPANLGTDWTWVLGSTSSQSFQLSKEFIGVNLRPWFNESPQKKASECCKNRKVLASLHGILARSEDLKAIDACFPGIPVTAPQSFSELLSFCENLSEGWAMRYHVLLAMLRARIPVIPLICDEKLRTLSLEAEIITPTEEDENFISSQKVSGNWEGAPRPAPILGASHSLRAVGDECRRAVPCGFTPRCEACPERSRKSGRACLLRLVARRAMPPFIEKMQEFLIPRKASPKFFVEQEQRLKSMQLAFSEYIEKS